MSLSSLENFGAALRVIDDVWSVTQSGNALLREDAAFDRLPDVGFEATAKKAALGRTVLERVAEIDIGALPEDLPYTLEIARQTAERWSREEDWYWLLFDPLGCGFYAMFAPTAYSAGYLLNSLAPAYTAHPFAESSDGDRYVALVRDYGRLARQFLDRTRGQAERGIYMPAPQLAQAIPLVEGLRRGASGLLMPEASRLAAIDADDVMARISAAIEDEVLPTFDAFLALLRSPGYAAAAPETVGLSQYPGGRDAYAELVRLHTTLDLTPDRVHATGLARLADIQAQMRLLLDEIGFSGTPTEFVSRLHDDTDWRASGVEEIGAVFQRYIDRIAPHIDRHFNFKPKAAHGIAPLPDAMTKSMTFGYYSPPTRNEARGIYMYNTPNLSGGPLAQIGALNYHELVPGHHFHMATQNENETLHPLRRKAFVNAFNEGWAEYAATLAGEMGMYEEPEERFGRMMMDAFLTCRLVVDTGMNAMDWSLEQARDYMREHAFMPETEIRSETVRYSCDIPGQALAYKLGDTVLVETRETMRAALGDRFDIRDFHDAVLKPGALPLPLVQRHVAQETARIAAG